MAIITLAEAKEFLGISDSTEYNAIIQALIPGVRDRVAQIVQNDFSSKLGVVGASVVFSAGARTLVANIDLADAGFVAGDDIIISGSYRNDGFRAVQSVSTVTLTLATSETVVEEIAGASIDIAVVQYPRGIKPTVAAMIRYDYQERPDRMGEKVESIGDYSATLDAAHFGYPLSIINGLLMSAGRPLGGFA